MAWTTPKTWTAALVTVDEMNTHVRDNLNWLKDPVTDIVSLAGQLTTTSTNFTDATGLTLTVTTLGGTVMVGFFGVIVNSGGSWTNVDLAVDGTRQGGTDGLVTQATASNVETVAFVTLVEGLAAGSHTFKIQWKVNAGTATLYAENSSASSKFEPTLWVRES